jgi:hypothetical protein
MGVRPWLTQLREGGQGRSWRLLLGACRRLSRCRQRGALRRRRWRRATRDEDRGSAGLQLERATHCKPLICLADPAQRLQYPDSISIYAVHDLQSYFSRCTVAESLHAEDEGLQPSRKATAVTAGDLALGDFCEARQDAAKSAK